MSKRVLWKKGMRLTDDILTKSDECTDRIISRALVLAASGRSGLLPAVHPFNISVDINDNVVDIISLSCLGITRDGTLIDIEYDSNYTISFEARAIIPNESTDLRYILCVAGEEEWADTNDGLRESMVSFYVVEENTNIPANMLPLARFVYDAHCWRMDDQNFLPPCLFISSSQKYETLASEFKSLLSNLDIVLPQKFITNKKDALKIFWPTVQQLLITMDKDCDIMTPLQFLGYVQKFISSFICACTLDEYIEIAEPTVYMEFIKTPYDYKNVYQKIRDGLGLSASIRVKVENFTSSVPEKKAHNSVIVEMPSIARRELFPATLSGNIQVHVTNNTPGSKIYYTIDGSTPSRNSLSGEIISIESGFNGDERIPEPLKKVDVKLIAVIDENSSDVASYTVKIRKGRPTI